MKIPDFQEITKKYQKKELWVELIVVGGIIILPTVIAGASYLFLRNKFYFNNPYVTEISYFAPGVVLSVICIVLSFWIWRRVEYNFKNNRGYHCPYCREQIAQAAPIVIATGNCPYCGKQVIDKDT